MGKWTELLKKPVQAQEIPKVTITFKRRYIEVNGIKFELLKSDADILDDSARLIERSEKLDTTDIKGVTAFLREMAGYVETVLGDGALEKISGGVRLGYADLLECVRVIVGAVYEAYQTTLAAKYGE